MDTRDNGLRAAAYTPLGGVPAGTAARVLERLRSAGIAAYVTGDPQAAGGGVLWVDSSAADQARETLGADGVSGSPAEVEAGGAGTGAPPAPAPPPPGGPGAAGPDALDESAWDAIVAAYDAPADGPVPPWPASEDLDGPAGVDRPGSGPDGDEPGGRDAAAPGDRPGRVPADEAPGREPAGPGGVEEEHFVPPTPPPVPPGDAVSRLAWAGVLGTPVVLFVVTLLGAEVPSWLVLLAVGGFVAGFVTLVARMQDRPPTDSGGDDGAVV